MRTGEDSIPTQGIGNGVIQNNFEWVIDENTTIEKFINQIQGKKLTYDEDLKSFVWVYDENAKNAIRMINAKGAAYIQGQLESLLLYGAKTTQLTERFINMEMIKLGRDMRHVLILKTKEFELDTVFFRSLKNKIMRMGYFSMNKSRDAKMLNILESTTQQRISQTSVNKQEGLEPEKKGLFGGLFK